MQPSWEIIAALCVVSSQWGVVMYRLKQLEKAVFNGKNNESNSTTTYS